MKAHGSIFYTTLGDFANCGNLLDYLIDNTKFLAFFDLKSRFRTDLKKSTLYIYSSKKLVKKIELLTYDNRLPKALAPLQQVVFFLSILQALWYAYKFNFKKELDFTLTTFSVASLATVIGRKLGFCKKTLLWHWDYMPMPKNANKNFLINFIDPLDKLAIKLNNYVWYASKNQFDIRIRLGQINNPKDARHTVVHWGNKSNIRSSKMHTKNEPLKILYMGSLLPEKGVTELLKSLPDLVKLTNGKIKLTLAGQANNPEYDKFLNDYVLTNKLNEYVTFYGYAKGNEKKQLMIENHIGVALYPKKINGLKNYGYYSDPAKLRDYISYGLPILLTDVPEISLDLVKYNAGILVEKLTPKSIISGIKKFISNPSKYYNGAYNFSKIDNYINYYANLFSNIK